MRRRRLPRVCRRAGRRRGRRRRPLRTSGGGGRTRRGEGRASRCCRAWWATRSRCSSRDREPPRGRPARKSQGESIYARRSQTSAPTASRGRRTNYAPPRPPARVLPPQVIPARTETFAALERAYNAGIFGRTAAAAALGPGAAPGAVPLRGRRRSAAARGSSCSRRSRSTTRVLRNRRPSARGARPALRRPARRRWKGCAEGLGFGFNVRRRRTCIDGGGLLRATRVAARPIARGDLVRAVPLHVQRPLLRLDGGAAARRHDRRHHDRLPLREPRRADRGNAAPRRARGAAPHAAALLGAASPTTASSCGSPTTRRSRRPPPTTGCR